MVSGDNDSWIFTRPYNRQFQRTNEIFPIPVSLQRKDGFDADDENAENGDVPSEDAITGKEEQLDELQSNQKNLFLIIFQVRANLSHVTEGGVQ